MLSRLVLNSKNSKPSNTRIPWILLGGLVMLASCSSAPAGDRQAVCREKFEKAEAGFKKEKYWQSQDIMEEILNECHGTGFMERTQFMMAESYFHEEEWVDARGEYTTFLLNFPSSPYAETAAFRKALSSYNMSYTDMRDDSPTQTAIRDFEDFRSNYPSSAFQDSATHFQDSLYNRLGEKDFQTASLYKRMNEPLAAAIYLKSFINEFPNSPRFFEAHLLIIDCYIKLQQFEQAEFYLERLAKQFPAAKSEYQSRQEDLADSKKSFEKNLKNDIQEKVYIKEDAKML